MIFPLAWLTLIIDLVLFVQFGFLAYIAWTRHKKHDDGVSPFLFFVSSSLAGLVVINMLLQAIILSGKMEHDYIMGTVQGIELIIRTSLMVSNVVYFIVIKKEVAAMRKEAMAPLKKLTNLRREIFEALDTPDETAKQPKNKDYSPPGNWLG